MIYKGNQKQGNVYKGATKIGKIYKGNQLIYQSISSITEYTISQTNYSENFTPIIPAGKKFRVELVSQTRPEYSFLLIDVENHQSFVIYQYSQSINNYNQDMINTATGNLSLMQKINDANKPSTIIFRIIIY